MLQASRASSPGTRASTPEHDSHTAMTRSCHGRILKLDTQPPSSDIYPPNGHNSTVQTQSYYLFLSTPARLVGWDLDDAESSKPSALPRTLSRARKMTVNVTPVIAGQVVHIKNNRRTTTVRMATRLGVTQRPTSIVVLGSKSAKYKKMGFLCRSRGLRSLHSRVSRPSALP